MYSVGGCGGGANIFEVRRSLRPEVMKLDVRHEKS